VNYQEVKEVLDQKAAFYNNAGFINDDPISIPHRFTAKADIEISAFLAANLAWGQRKAILKKCSQLIALMDNSPGEFLASATDKELVRFNTFVYRTFNGADAQYYICALREIYKEHGGLETIFTNGYLASGTVKGAIENFRCSFLAYSPLKRTTRHVADVQKGSAAKRMNMFLRWMVRDDGIVDFGLWKRIPKTSLMIPLDTHVASVARKLGLLTRRQNDWKAVEELTAILRGFKPEDPVYYDFALFGAGVYEKRGM